MICNKTISLVLPSRGVAHILQQQLESIPEYIDEIVLVSNKSKDNTYEAACELMKTMPKLKVFQDDRTDVSGIGYGYAIQTGFEHATGDYVFKSDFDGTYPLDKIEYFVHDMERNNLFFAVGTRYPVMNESHVKLFNQVGVTVLNYVNWIKNGVLYHDILCGMYGGRREYVSHLHCTEGGWNMSVEFKLRAAKMYPDKVKQYHIMQHVATTASNQRYFETGMLHLNYVMNFSV